MATFVKSTSPFIRKEASTKRMMIDVLIALTPLVIFSVAKFGSSALIRVIVAVIVMILAEVGAVMIRHKPHPRVKGFKARFNDRLKKVSLLNLVTPAISAIIFAMMIPATLSLYVVVISAFVGIVIAKLVFGGLGSNIFNPAAVAFIIALVSFAAKFNYVGVDAIAGSTPLGAIGNSLLNIKEMVKNYSLLDLFLGNIPGGMGEISAFLIILGGVYLFVRKAADFRITVSMVLVFALLMLIGALAVGAANPFEVVLYQVLSGGLLFGAVFMATDPVTAPVTKPGRLIYGLILGVVVVLIRLFGSNVEGVAYAILIVNMFTPLIDYHKWSNTRYSWKMLLGYGVSLILMALIVFTGLGGFK